MDGNLQLAEHLVVGGLPNGIFRDELILQAVVHEVFCRNASCKQPSNLVDHALVESLAQAAGDLLTACLAVDAYTYYYTRDGRQRAKLRGVLQVVGLYLDGADGPLRGVHVRLVVHVRARLPLQADEHLRELLQRATFQLVAQGWVLRHGRQLVALQH